MRYIHTLCIKYSVGNAPAKPEDLRNVLRETMNIAETQFQ